MLMNLLPGLRELRAPLASGYLWLISAWLFLGHMDWLPSERPPGNGEVARLWDLGGTLGKTVVLAAITFIAYLIGSFLETGPDGRIAGALAPIVLADRRPWYLRHTKSRIIEEAMTIASQYGPHGYSIYMSIKVNQSISREARRDLKGLFERRNIIPSERLIKQGGEELRASIRSRELHSKDRVEDELITKAERMARDFVRINEMATDAVAVYIVDEMQQLASRLLVTNEKLYGRYDRQMAEASVRINISVPLTVLLLLGVWMSTLPLWLRLALTVVTLSFGYMLLRQGFLRAVSARDVIVQALVIDQVESRYTRESPPESPAKAEEPMEDQTKDRPSAQ